MPVLIEGPNAGFSFIKAHDASYEYHSGLIFEHTTENDDRIQKLEHVKNLLQAINADFKGATEKKLDYSRSGPQIGLFQEVHKFAPHILGEQYDNSFVFDEKRVELLRESLAEESKSMMRKMGPDHIIMQELFQRRNQITDLISEVIKEYRNYMKTLTRNQRVGSS